MPRALGPGSLLLLPTHISPSWPEPDLLWEGWEGLLGFSAPWQSPEPRATAVLGQQMYRISLITSLLTQDLDMRCDNLMTL